MSRCYLDTNFLYAHLRSGRRTPRPVAAWRARVVSEITDSAGVISALVLDELAYRLVLAWLRDDGDSDPLSAYRRDTRNVMRAVRSRLSMTWDAIDSLSLELQPTSHAVVAMARGLMSQPGVAPRDAFHAAHALEAGCDVIVSSDAGFDGVPGLARLAP